MARTSKEQVLSVDSQAKFQAWGDPAYEGASQPGWIHGRGWETKICSSEELAWKAAFPHVFGEEVSCATDRQYV